MLVTSLHVNASQTWIEQKDPFLDLSEDCTLISGSTIMYAPEYATDSDETAAFNSLNLISLAGDLSNEAVAARIVEASPTLIEVIL